MQKSPLPLSAAVAPPPLYFHFSISPFLSIRVTPISIQLLFSYLFFIFLVLFAAAVSLHLADLYPSC